MSQYVTLKFEIGNDDVQTVDDVVRLLRNYANSLDTSGFTEIEDLHATAVTDANGNVVGRVTVHTEGVEDRG